MEKRDHTTCNSNVLSVKIKNLSMMNYDGMMDEL